MATQAFAIDVNLANALTLTGGTLSLNFANTGTLPVTTTFAIPRTNSNLAAGQLDLIEDFTGVVSNATNTGVTITPSAPLMNSQPIAALTILNTSYDPDPTNSFCTSGTIALTSCVSNNQAASMDAILNTDGTFTVQEIEPLLNSPIVDTVEGTVYRRSSTNAVNSPVQYDRYEPHSGRDKLVDRQLERRLQIHREHSQQP